MSGPTTPRNISTPSRPTSRKIFGTTPSSLKADEYRGFDDLLNPKWKGKIAILDPRTAGGGTSSWAFFYKVKGEEFLRKLATQETDAVA